MGKEPSPSRPRVQVKISGYLASWTGSSWLEVEARTIDEALHELLSRIPSSHRHHLRHPTYGRWEGFFLVLNDENLPLSDAPGRPLASGDVLSVIPPVAGG